MDEQNSFAPTGAGAVVADIGGDRGALILYAPEALLGTEIEISLAGGQARTHMAVRERRAGERTLCAAFYPSLVAGVYMVWSTPTSPAGTVTIVGGVLSEELIDCAFHEDRPPTLTVALTAPPSHAGPPIGAASAH